MDEDRTQTIIVFTLCIVLSILAGLIIADIWITDMSGNIANGLHAKTNTFFKDNFGLLLNFQNLLLVLIMSIVIGILFNRQIIVWNFVILLLISLLYSVIISTTLIAPYHNAPSFVEYILGGKGLVKNIIGSLIFSCFFTIIAFLTSIIGGKTLFFRNIQETFHRLPTLSSILCLFSSYFFFSYFISMIFLLKYISLYENELFHYLTNISYFLIPTLILLFSYNKAKQLPVKIPDYKKSDYIYFSIMVLVYLVFFLFFSFARALSR